MVLGDVMPYCAKCGKELDKDATFCSRCGAAVSAERKAELRTRDAEAKRQEACFGPPGSGGGCGGLKFNPTNQHGTTTDDGTTNDDQTTGTGETTTNG